MCLLSCSVVESKILNVRLVQMKSENFRGYFRADIKVAAKLVKLQLR